MRIHVNGQLRECGAELTVSTLLADLGLTERRVAVEVNREIVPRSAHANRRLRDEDRVEIVVAIGGG